MIALALATAAAGLAVPLAAAPSASADRCAHYYGLMNQGGSIDGFHFLNCDGTRVDLDVTIQRHDPSSGNWSVVATGRGVATYYCNGSEPHWYRQSGVPENEWSLIMANCS